MWLLNRLSSMFFFVYTVLDRSGAHILAKNGLSPPPNFIAKVAPPNVSKMPFLVVHEFLHFLTKSQKCCFLVIQPSMWALNRSNGKHTHIYIYVKMQHRQRPSDKAIDLLAWPPLQILAVKNIFCFFFVQILGGEKNFTWPQLGPFLYQRVPH